MIPFIAESAKKKRPSFHKFFLIFLLLSFFSFNTQASSPEFGGTLSMGTFEKFSEINPITTDSTISANLLDLLFNNLVHVSEDGRVRPELAQKWEISEDGLTWTFYLRKDILFHDGTSLTAEDVAATYETIRQTPLSGNYHAFEYVKAITVSDPYTLQILLKRPDNFLWENLGVIGIAPKEGLMDLEDFNQHPIGSGPYVFVKQDEREIIFASNLNYFQGRPYLDHFILKTSPNQRTNLLKMVEKKIDVAMLINPYDPIVFFNVSHIETYTNWHSLLYMLVFNQKNALFTSSEVRRALNEAVDKTQLTQRTFKKEGTLASGTVFPEMSDYNSQVTVYSYQPEEALKVLQKEGWSDSDNDFILDKEGKPFEFTVIAIEGDNIAETTLPLIKNQLLKVGIKMNIEALPFNKYVERTMRQKNFEAQFVHFHLPSRLVQDSNYALWHSSQMRDGLNYVSYHNADVDRLLEEVRLNPDPAGRKYAFWEFQKYLHDDPPGIFLFWQEIPFAFRKGFQDVPNEPMQSFRDFIRIWIPRDEQRNSS